MAFDGLPISPELILVSSPEEQQRARELLPPAPADEWDRLLARVRSRTAAEDEAEQISPPRSRKPRRTLVLASLVLVAVAVPIGMAGARDNVGVGGARSTKAHRVTSPAAHPAAAPVPIAPKAPAVQKPAVKAVHPAGQPSATEKAKPKSAPAKAKTQPKAPKPATTQISGFVPSRVWGWVAQPGSKSYLFRLYRNGRQVYTARSKQAQLVLPGSFHFAPGKYRWSVVAVTGSAKRGLKPVVESTFVLSTAAAAKANG